MGQLAVASCDQATIVLGQISRQICLYCLLVCDLSTCRQSVLQSVGPEDTNETKSKALSQEYSLGNKLNNNVTSIVDFVINQECKIHTHISLWQVKS